MDYLYLHIRITITPRCIPHHSIPLAARNRRRRPDLLFQLPPLMIAYTVRRRGLFLQRKSSTPRARLADGKLGRELVGVVVVVGRGGRDGDSGPGRADREFVVRDGDGARYPAADGGCRLGAGFWPAVRGGFPEAGHLCLFSLFSLPVGKLGPSNSRVGRKEEEEDGKVEVVYMGCCCPSDPSALRRTAPAMLAMPGSYVRMLVRLRLV